MDWLMLLKAFVIGGVICVIGQLLIDLTAMTPARILVLFVVMGVVLTAIGLYEPIVEFAGAGATVPLTGFGYTLAKGVEEAVKERGCWAFSPGASPVRRAASQRRWYSATWWHWWRNPGINPDSSPLRRRTP